MTEMRFDTSTILDIVGNEEPPKSDGQIPCRIRPYNGRMIAIYGPDEFLNGEYEVVDLGPEQDIKEFVDSYQ